MRSSLNAWTPSQPHSGVALLALGILATAHSLLLETVPTGSDVALRSLPFALALYPKPEPRYWGTTE